MSDAAPALYYLHTFHCVAREHSFTRAARTLNLSQPAVSAHIRALEHYYAAQLFEVRQRRTHLTAAGEALFAYTSRVFHLLDEANQVLDAARRGQQGLLRFGASTTLGNYLLPTVLGGFVATHVAVGIEATIGTSSDVLVWLLAERIQFGIVEAPVQHADVEVEAIGQDELVLIAPPGHPLARGVPIPPERLSQQPILRREASSGTQQLVDRELERTRGGVNPPTLMVLGSTEALKQAVLAGLGLAWVPRLAVVHELARGELARVGVAGLRISRTPSLIRLRGARLSATAEALVACLRAGLGEEPGDRIE